MAEGKPALRSHLRAIAFLSVLAVALLAMAGCEEEAESVTPATHTVDSATATLPSAPTPLPAETPGSVEPSHLVPPDEAIRFDSGALQIPGISFSNPTTLAFGPDGRLYVAQQNGAVIALTLDGQSVTNVELVAPESALEDVLGLAFNHNDTPDPVTLYVSQTAVFRGFDAPPYPGKITKLVAPDWEPVDVITGLPVAAGEHATNGMVFDDEGRLFIAQGAGTNAGVPGDRHPRPESPLSAAVLVADLTDPAFDGAVRYEPPGQPGPAVNQVGGDVRVFASGFRNPYDLVRHSNGLIYATENGANGPDGGESIDCQTEGLGPWGPDELNLIAEDGYYGQPNRNRARFDARQCSYAIPRDTSRGGTPPIATLGYSTSANGLAEYTAHAFDDRLLGNLIYVEWQTGGIMRVVLSDDGRSVVSISRLVPDELKQPLDVVVGPDGTVYVAEWSAHRIAYFTPTEPT